jgi:glycosyltransferase involved in cell wall biosynthesis
VYYLTLNLSMNNTFSIIIPTYNRARTILRALSSAVWQQYPKDKFEVIVVDDGSTDNTEELLKELSQDIQIIFLGKNEGRLVARNMGMKMAKHDWICWLDSDDEYLTTYLDTINNAINEFPTYKIFNFGAVAFDEANYNSWLRDTFLPDTQANGVGHVAFKSGGLGTGSFVFSRTLYEKYGGLPEARTPYGDDASLPALATQMYPELRELYGQTEDGQWKPFGNPWGDDWLYFYILTRENISKPLPIHLYLQHVRR